MRTIRRTNGKGQKVEKLLQGYDLSWLQDELLRKFGLLFRQVKLIKN